MSTCLINAQTTDDCYVEYLEEVLAILEECTTTKIAIASDFNVAVSTFFKNRIISPV